MIVDHVESNRPKGDEVVRTQNGRYTVALMVADIKNNQAFFVRQIRKPAVNELNPTGELLEVCAGRVERGETISQTAKKEIKEELRIEVSENDIEWFFDGKPKYPSPGILDEMIYFGYVLIDESQIDKSTDLGGVAEEGEIIRRIGIKFDEVVNLQFDDMKTTLIVSEFLKRYQKTFERRN